MKKGIKHQANFTFWTHILLQYIVEVAVLAIVLAHAKSNEPKKQNEGIINIHILYTLYLFLIFSNNKTVQFE